uniref:Uncharacterized protein n=1 Tax=Cynoglossus semilaevis TaxID=244447 RepID=A0A3P8VNM3_CYNSE
MTGSWGLKKRTRKALGLRKKDKDTETSYASPDVDDEGFSLRPGEEAGKHFFSSSDSDDDEDNKKKFKIRIKPLVSDSARCMPPTMDELKASVGGLALSPSLVSTAPPRSDLPGGRDVRRSAPIYLNVLPPSSYGGCPGPDLDDVFGPVDSPRTSEDTASPRWVTFTDDRPPPPDEPAPPPPPDSPAPDTPSSTPSSPCLSPGPPPNDPPPSPPPFSPGSPPAFTPLDSPTSIMLGPPPPDEPAPPLPPDFSPSDSPPFCLDEEAIDEEVLQLAVYSSCPPISPVPPLPADRSSPSARVTSPLVRGSTGGKRTPDSTYLRDDLQDFMGSPRELTPTFRATPPPLPPTTYRSIMSSPGPYSGSCE